MTVPLFRAGLARSACEVNCVVKQSAARTHRSELTGSIVRRGRNPLALARGGGQEQEYKLDKARLTELSNKMSTLIDKWTDIIAKADIKSADDLQKLYWQEVYSHIDVNRYGQ